MTYVLSSDSIFKGKILDLLILFEKFPRSSKYNLIKKPRYNKITFHLLTALETQGFSFFSLLREKLTNWKFSFNGLLLGGKHETENFL